MNLLQILVTFAWLAWTIGWRIAARKVKPTARQENRGSIMLRSAQVYISFVLLTADWFWPDSARFHSAWLFTHFIAGGTRVEAISVVLVCAGFGFTTWARIQLAQNWSGSVTVKEGHELVESGPYRVVRHPIYTGLLLAVFGTALCNGEYRGLFALLLVTIALWRKLQLEEQWMTEIFGERYEKYKRRVAALVPFVI